MADTHVFGSRRGYECLSKSPGVSAGEDAVLSEFGFGQSSDERFLEGLATSATALGRPLPSGRYAITRVIRGPKDDGGRPTLERRTIILSASDYLKLRHGLSGLVDDQALWGSAAFADGRPVSVAATTAASAVTGRDWQLFDAWVLALEQSKAAIAGKDAQAARDVIALAGRLAEADALDYRWGIRLLSPIAWVDMLTLSPYGTIDGRRQVHGATNGPCVHPDVRVAQQRRPDRLPSRTALDPEPEPSEMIGLEEEPEAPGEAGLAAHTQARKGSHRSRSAWVRIAIPIAVLAIAAASITVVAVTMVRSRSAPTGTQASKGESQEHVRVSWDRVSGARGYRIFRAQQNGAPSEIKGEIGPDTVEYLDTEAQAGTGYTYTVKAITHFGDSDAGAPADGWRAVAAPARIMASDGTSVDHVRVTWGKVEGASGYDVVRRRTATGEETPIRVEDPAAMQWDDSSAVAGTPYAYSVRAITPMGVGREGAGDLGWRGVPPPRDVRVVEGELRSPGCVELRWEPVPDATGYNIYRSEGTGSPELLDTASADSTSYRDQTARPGKEFSYTVRAIMTAGEGQASDPVRGERALETPRNLRATEGDSRQHVELNWDAVEGSTEYELLRSDSREGPTSSLTKSRSTNGKDATGTPGKAYWYRVRALGPATGSVASEPVRGWRNIERPELKVVGDASNGGPITLSWAPVKHAEKYRVYRASAEKGEPDLLATTLASEAPGESVVWKDQDAAEGTSYWYSVQAMAAAGPGEASPRVKATRRAEPARVEPPPKQQPVAAPPKSDPVGEQPGATELAGEDFGDVRAALECFRSASMYLQEFRKALSMQSTVRSMLDGTSAKSIAKPLNAWISNQGPESSKKLREAVDAFPKESPRPGESEPVTLAWNARTTKRALEVHDSLAARLGRIDAAVVELRNANLRSPKPESDAMDRGALVRAALELALVLKAIDPLNSSGNAMTELDRQLASLKDPRLTEALDELDRSLKLPEVTQAITAPVDPNFIRDPLDRLRSHFDVVKQWRADASAPSADRTPETWVGWSIRIRSSCDDPSVRDGVKELQKSLGAAPADGWTPQSMLEAILASSALKDAVEGANPELKGAITFVRQEIAPQPTKGK